LARFAETILFLLDPEEEVAISKAQQLLADFWSTFQACWTAGMRGKIGLLSDDADDVRLIEELLMLMQAKELDYSVTFRDISRQQALSPHLRQVPGFAEWHARWLGRLSQERNGRAVDDSLVAMQRSNPLYIPRNFRVEEAISAGVEHGDFSVMDRLVDALKDPYTECPEFLEYAAAPPASWREYRTFCGT
jgi:uncharacterized protein YdiU (UPF0061 family)